MAQKSAPSDQSAPEHSARRHFLDHTNLYGFELFMASVALTVSAWAIDYAATAILRHVAGIDPSGIGEFSICLVAVAIVWLPLSIGF